MREPSLRTSRLAIAGGFVAALAIGATGFLVGRAARPAQPPSAQATAPAAPEPSPSPPPRVLGRSQIIELAGRYVDAVASASLSAPDGQSLVGRRVDLAIPFGCAGPDPADSQAGMRWQYDSASETLRISVTPQVWQDVPWGIDRPLEGFWLSYPWMTRESCPAGAQSVTSTEPAVSAAPAETLAIAQLLPASPPDGTRPQSFAIVKRVAADQLDLESGFRLRLIGRVTALPGGQPVRCAQPQGAGFRPVCVVSVAFDEISVENAGPAATLGTWTLGQASERE